MTADDAPVARMDRREVRAAYIDLRICELRVLACETALQYWRERCEECEPLALALMVRQAMKRIASNG
jgi:hypothetical protein